MLPLLCACCHWCRERQQRLLQQELQRQVAAIQADIAAEQAAGGYSALGFASVDGPLGSLSLGGAAAAQSRQVDEAERMLEEDMNGSDGEEEDEEDGCGSRGVQNWRAGERPGAGASCHTAACSGVLGLRNRGASLCGVLRLCACWWGAAVCAISAPPGSHLLRWTSA